MMFLADLAILVLHRVPPRLHAGRKHDGNLQAATATAYVCRPDEDDPAPAESGARAPEQLPVS